MPHIYNLKRERLDSVKVSFEAPDPSVAPSIDLRSKFCPVFDQGQLGSCTANALMGVFHFDDLVQTFYGSRLFLYYNERSLDGDVSQDAGSTISQGVNALNAYGVCSEVSWPYDVSQYTTKPSDACYLEALQHKAITYYHVTQDQDNMKGCLLLGNPIALGVTLYPSFESDQVAKDGIVSMPSDDDMSQGPLGGHAIVCCGYDDNLNGGCWIMRNSWGDSWGDKGYFYLPYAYLTDQNLCSDLWKITKVSD